MRFLAACATAMLAMTAVAQTTHAQYAGMADREHAAIHIAYLWEDENFGELEKLAHEYRTKPMKTSSGKRMISVYYEVLTKLMGANIAAADGAGSAKARLARWAKFAPTSPTPHLAKVIEFRNSSLAFDVDRALASPAPRSGSQIEQPLRAALELLNSKRSILEGDPFWHFLRLEVLRDLGADPETFFKAYNESFEKHQLYEGLYWSATQYILRQKKKDLQLLEDLATAAFENTRTIAGAEAYAMTYHYAFAGGLTIPDLQNGPIDWERFFEGWDAHTARHPDQFNLNYSAAYACIWGNVKRTKEAFTRLSGPPVRSVWMSEQIFQGCRRWIID